MKIHIYIILALFFMPISICAEDLSENKIRWYSLEDGLKTAKPENKPILINFTISRKNTTKKDACSFRKKLLFNDDKIALKLTTEFIPINIDLSNFSIEEKTVLNKYEFATGKLNFCRESKASADYIIPYGSILLTWPNGRIKYKTTDQAVLSYGETCVTVPAVATIEGANGNINSVSKVFYARHSIIGVRNIENATTFSGSSFADNCLILFMNSDGNIVTDAKDNKMVLFIDVVQPRTYSFVHYLDTVKLNAAK